MDVSLLIFILLLFSHFVFFTITIYNMFTAPRIKNLETIKIKEEKISILVPARNEERNICKLIKSVEEQSYKNYELIILDDNSTDSTFFITEEISKRNKKIKVIKGKELPDGWLGKNWACYQLSELASGELYLFLDADVTLEKFALTNALNRFHKFNLDMLTVFPTQIISSFGELFVVPLMNWLLLTFLPLKFVYSLKSKTFIAANGQFILISKEAYNNIGTHSEFRNKVVEDMEIVHKLKEQTKKVMVCVGNNSIKTKMYRSFPESINGFSKNFFPGFKTSKIVFFFLISLFLILFLAPLFLSIWYPYYLIIVAMILLERVIVSIISRENIIYSILLHPAQMIIMFIVGFISVSKKGKTWKGRII